MYVECDRVVVRINTASPELAADLAVVEPRLRAERLRMLATIGLAMLRGQAPKPSVPPRLDEAATGMPEAPAEAPDELAGRKARLLDRLG